MIQSQLKKYAEKQRVQRSVLAWTAPILGVVFIDEVLLFVDVVVIFEAIFFYSVVFIF